MYKIIYCKPSTSHLHLLTHTCPMCNKVDDVHRNNLNRLKTWRCQKAYPAVFKEATFRHICQDIVNVV